MAFKFRLGIKPVDYEEDQQERVDILIEEALDNNRTIQRLAERMAEETIESNKREYLRGYTAGIKAERKRTGKE